MSAQSMSPSERVTVVKSLGYSDREAAFLCLAALHGGYFLRRQYCSFIGKEPGGSVAALLEKLLGQQHAVALTALNNTRIYHLSSRPFYTALGEPDNRNRRDHSPTALKSRLMALDFVLAHRDYRYLATEREKLDYFTGNLGIGLAALPNKRYISLKTASTTTRYFVDKYPIFLKESSADEPGSTVCFCFIDPGSATLSGFETYLEQYSGLWRLLKSFEVVHVADTRHLQPGAERRFRVFLSQLDGSGEDAGRRIAKRLLEHFQARFLYEKGDLGSFTRDRLIRLRNEMAEFSEAKYQALYVRWKAVGAQAVASLVPPDRPLGHAYQAGFSTCLLEHRYDFFGMASQQTELSPGADGPTPQAAQGVGAVHGSPMVKGRQEGLKTKPSRPA